MDLCHPWMDVYHIRVYMSYPMEVEDNALDCHHIQSPDVLPNVLIAKPHYKSLLS